MTTEEEAKFARDKFVLTPHKNPTGEDDIVFKPTAEHKAQAVSYYQVNGDNFDAIIGKPREDKPKKPAAIFGRLGQAENFVEKQPLYYDRSGLWWVWNQGLYCWQQTDEVEICNYLNGELGIDTINTTARNEILQALKQVSRRNAPLPLPVSWVQFKDTIVDIESGEEFKASSAYFTVNPAPYGLHKDKFMETPIMDRIFEEWVGKDHVRTLYEILAYCLLADYPIHRLFCFIGAGMNGKTCFLRMVEKFVGRQNCCSTELDSLLNSRFEVTRLHKKLVCIMGETNFNEITKTSILKKLTGQDLIGFEYKNKNPFEEKNYAKILIATNNLPETTDKTIGFYRRWHIIDFPNQFSEQEDILATIPEAEYESLALKSIGILHDLLKSRKFSSEGSIEERQRVYEEKSNPFDKFYRDNVEEDSVGDIAKWDFEKRFSEWCKANRFRTMADVTIAKHMKAKGINEIKIYKDWFDNNMTTRKQIRCWAGIRWKV